MGEARVLEQEREEVERIAREKAESDLRGQQLAKAHFTRVGTELGIPEDAVARFVDNLDLWKEQFEAESQKPAASESPGREQLKAKAEKEFERLAVEAFGDKGQAFLKKLGPEYTP